MDLSFEERQILMQILEFLGSEKYLILN